MKYAVVNEKGGVLKTTSAVHLAAAAAGRGQRALLVDLDPQSNATTWMGAREGAPSKTIFELLLDYKVPAREAIGPSTVPGLDVLYASRRFREADRLLVDLRRPLHFLSRLLHDVEGEYDAIFLDCAPTASRVSENAIVAADAVICPVDAAKFGLDGLMSLMATMEGLVADEILDQPKPIFVARTLWQARTVIARDVDGLLRKAEEQYPYLRVLSRTVRVDVRGKEAPHTQQVLWDYDRRSQAGMDYKLLAEELELLA